jgi:hypothetical protein
MDKHQELISDLRYDTVSMEHNKMTVRPRSKKSMPGALQSGDLCPGCGKTELDYDGLLNLSCSECGFAVSGGCT